MFNTWNALSSLDPILDDVMGSAFGTAVTVGTFEPAVDVRTTEDEYRFVCDVPGIKPEDLDVTLERRVLTIKGRRRFEANQGEHVVLGRRYGEFTRVFELPEGIAEDQLRAEIADGVLTLSVPKHPAAKPRKIQVLSKGPKQLTE
jgi:HSP20 family protein